MKETVKNLANFVASLLALPFVGCYQLSKALIGETQAFPGYSQAVSVLPGFCGIYFRRSFYRFVLPYVGRDACICFGTVFSHPGVSVGNTAYLGVGCMIGDAEIGDDVLIGSHVSIINGNRQHGIDRLDLPIREQAGVYPRITIGQDSWIGDRAIVMSNVGRHCVIGAGSVVTKPVNDFEIVVGNPAKVIGRRDELQPAKDSA